MHRSKTAFDHLVGADEDGPPRVALLRMAEIWQRLAKEQDRATRLGGGDGPI